MVRVDPSRLIDGEDVSSSASHSSWAWRSAGHAIIVVASWPATSSFPSCHRAAPLIALHPAEAPSWPPAKLSVTRVPSTSSNPRTSVDVYVRPSRSSPDAVPSPDAGVVASP